MIPNPVECEHPGKFEDEVKIKFYPCGSTALYWCETISRFYCFEHAAIAFIAGLKIRLATPEDWTIRERKQQMKVEVPA
jgi:hypothetical protein